MERDRPRVNVPPMLDAQINENCGTIEDRAAFTSLEDAAVTLALNGVALHAMGTTRPRDADTEASIRSPGFARAMATSLRQPGAKRARRRFPSLSAPRSIVGPLPTLALVFAANASPSGSLDGQAHRKNDVSATGWAAGGVQSSRMSCAGHREQAPRQDNRRPARSAHLTPEEIEHITASSTGG